MGGERIIIVGDVHGCSVELNLLLNEIQPRSGDQIFFLGDMVNRGPDSHGVLQIFRSLPGARALLGNHELRLLRMHERGDFSGAKSVDLDTSAQLTNRDWETLKRFEGPILLEEQKTLLVHAGFLPNIAWRSQGLDITTDIQVVCDDGRAWRRGCCPTGMPWIDLWNGPLFAIYGHTPHASVKRRQWSLGIDTACVTGGHLSACVLPGREIVQVKAQENYASRLPVNLAKSA